jgi:hypothetical protein
VSTYNHTQDLLRNTEDNNMEYRESYKLPPTDEIFDEDEEDEETKVEGDVRESPQELQRKLLKGAIYRYVIDLPSFSTKGD